VAKKGTKRSLLTDGKGIPLSVIVDGANRHDKMLVKGTLDDIIIERPSHKVTQNMCMDKGYDFLISENWLATMAILLTFGDVEKKT